MPPVAVLAPGSKSFTSQGHLLPKSLKMSAPSQMSMSAIDESKVAGTGY